MNNDQIWQAVLGEIELNLSKANFTTWFKNTFISSFEDGKMIICVPNTFTKTWLEKKYHDKIAKALESICNEKIKEIYYKIEIKKNNPMDELLKKIKIKKDEINQEPILTNRFGLNNRYVFKNFVVGRGNELAHAAALAVTKNLGKV